MKPLFAGLLFLINNLTALAQQLSNKDSLEDAYIFLATHSNAVSQQLSYNDSLQLFQKNYVSTHEVVKGSDKAFFQFYKVDEKYRIVARFEKIIDTAGFIMKTSGTRKTKYFRYGMLYFNIGKDALHLTIYQSERLMADTAYKNYLFVPFTDLTSGEKSYGGGRYLDFIIDDIKNNSLIIDFNKSYNPYCAYMAGFSCPIPPAENYLTLNIEAGEMEFAKKH
ncbi:MAG: DUF1684 domain-containing protein [Ferruginibacter sp.]